MEVPESCPVPELGSAGLRAGVHHPLAPRKVMKMEQDSAGASAPNPTKITCPSCYGYGYTECVAYYYGRAECCMCGGMGILRPDGEPFEDNDELEAAGVSR